MNDITENITNSVGGGDSMNTADAASLVTALEGEVTASHLFGTLTPFVGIIGVMILVSLSFYFVRKIVKGAGKGKVRM